MSSLSEDGGIGVTQCVHGLCTLCLFDQVRSCVRTCVCVCVCRQTVAVLPCGLLSLCVLSSSKALCPHSSSLSSLALSSSFSLISSPSQDTLWAGLCSERQADAEGRLGATLHTATPRLLAIPRTLDMSERKLLICRDTRKYPESSGKGKPGSYYSETQNANKFIQDFMRY